MHTTTYIHMYNCNYMYLPAYIHLCVYIYITACVCMRLQACGRGLAGSSLLLCSLSFSQKTKQKKKRLVKRNSQEILYKCLVYNYNAFCLVIYFHLYMYMYICMYALCILCIYGCNAYWLTIYHLLAQLTYIQITNYSVQHLIAYIWALIAF